MVENKAIMNNLDLINYFEKVIRENKDIVEIMETKAELIERFVD